MQKFPTFFATLGFLMCLVITSCTTTQSLNESRVKSKPSPAVSMDKDSLGTVYISVEGRMLFKPGTSSVDPKVKRELKPLGKLMYESDENMSIVIKSAIANNGDTQATPTDSWAL